MIESDKPMDKSNIDDLQLQMDKFQHGYCLFVKLLNCDEFYAMTNNTGNDIINDLMQMIDKICKDLSISTYKQLVKYNQILLIFSFIDSKLIEEFVLKLYSLSQLYVNDKISYAYMNCRIAAIEFPKFTYDAKKIYILLNWLLSCSDDYNYYRKYDPKYYNLESVKESNIQLNLLRNALACKKMVFAYQPIIDRKTMTIHYYECLLRILDKNNEYISIGPLVQDAEHKGLIHIIDKLVLEMAIKELYFNQDLILAVNISNIGTLDDSLLVLAENLLQTYNVAKRLIIEITETSLNENYTKVAYFMNKLKEFGCKFALDDFGAGFTSFKQLQYLPISIIKIDGDYVRNIISDVQSQSFVKRLIEISEDLGIETVAEFVENGEIAQFLIDLKVTGMQGNFYSSASINRIKTI